MERIRSFIFAVIFLVPYIGNAQHHRSPDSLLDKLIGNWVLTGTIAGKQTTHDVHGQRVLNGQYLQLTETSREKDKDGHPAYDATVFFCWQESRGRFFCLWLDNTSNEGITNKVIGEAKQNDDKIELVFTYQDGTRFFNSFLYEESSDTWQWLLNGEENGRLKPFANVKLTKQ
jgi:hypothetical protein